jgi:predicted DNA-binding transcriptional regulator AlpA
MIDAVLNQNHLAAGVGANLLTLGGKREVARMGGVSRRTVDNWIAHGCPHLKISPRLVRFDLADVREWLKSQFGTRRNGKVSG